MLLDIMMTIDTEGFGLAFELKNKPRFENLPINILTSFLGKVREGGWINSSIFWVKNGQPS
jgi:hypothetical protein